MPKKKRKKKSTIYSATETRRTDHITKGKVTTSYRRTRPE